MAAFNIGKGKSGFFSTISLQESLFGQNLFLDEDSELVHSEGRDISGNYNQTK